jgi:hypothetical protein
MMPSLGQLCKVDLISPSAGSGSCWSIIQPAGPTIGLGDADDQQHQERRHPLRPPYPLQFGSALPGYGFSDCL